uniref:Reverse transcriptase domain-containing protein n=1 Tax=Tanacetum cinerariifolium TaxID=118510 RepID=A0A6L2K9L3_TANCI|nr:hypothetical protein [Tanacetum cinerariifolium]
MSIQNIEDLKQQYLDEMKSLINLEYRNEIKINELKKKFNGMNIEINKNKKLQQLEQVANLSTYPSQQFNSFCYDDDDDEDNTIAITPDFLITDSLSMGDEHLSTISKMKSNELIKSSVENLVLIPSEFEDEYECDVPDCDDSQTTNFSMFSNPLFDDSTSSDDESSHEEVIYEMGYKAYSNPLFDLDEEIIFSEFNLIYNDDLDSTPKNDHVDTKSYLLKSLLNRDTLMASSPKFDSLLEEFFGELAHTDLIPSGINEANCDPKEDIHLVERLLYDNSSPRPSEEFNFKNSNAIIESFSPSPIPIEDSDPFMEEIDLFLASDGSIPPGIDSDYSDSEGDNLFPERLLHDDPIPPRDTLDFSNVVRVFLPFFTYPVNSSFLLSFGSEDTIFDPGISNYHFSSLEPGVSYRSGTFMKFNVYPNHLNESPMEILCSTCFPMDQ